MNPLINYTLYIGSYLSFLKYSLVLILGFSTLSAYAQSNDAVSGKEKSILKKNKYSGQQINKAIPRFTWGNNRD